MYSRKNGRVPILDLSRYLPYLLNRAGVRIAMAFSEEIRRFGITLPMWRVLAQLWHDEFQRQNDISERTAIEPATLSRLLKSIEAKGLILRTRSSTNAREVGVALTRKGRALTQRVIPLAMRYEALAIGSMSPEKVDLVKDALIEIYQNIASYHDVLKGKVPRPARPAAGRRPAARARTLRR
jgi:DNA-binding MarR family transcriptional regulator